MAVNWWFTAIESLIIDWLPESSAFKPVLDEVNHVAQVCCW